MPRNFLEGSPRSSASRYIPRQQIIKAFSTLGEPTYVEKLCETNNILYKVTVKDKAYVLKIYDTKAPGKDMEPYVLTKIPNLTHARKMLVFDDGCGIIAFPYAIYPFIDGRALHEELDAGLSKTKAKAYAEDIAEIVKSLARVETKGFGFVDEEIEGVEVNWYGFMIRESKQTDAKPLRKHLPSELIERVLAVVRKNTPRKVESTLVQWDLNSHNFLISDDELKMIDLGAVAAGDKLFPLGEFMAHYYKTPLWVPFIGCFKLSKKQMRAVRTYALFCDFGILRAAVTMTSEPAKTAKPWGNKHTFLELINSHLNALE